MIDEIIGSATFVRGDGNHKYHNGYEDSTYRKMEELS